MLTLARACDSGEVPAEVKVVVAPRADAPALIRAAEAGLTLETVDPGENYGERLVRALADVDWICLAGYLRLLPKEVLQAFPHRVLNIHPALLPKFGGQGMYGLRVHQAVLDAGESVSGCTVHYVNERYDEGAIILQKRCQVLCGDTAEVLAERVLALEHLAYPEALAKVIRER